MQQYDVDIDGRVRHVTVRRAGNAFMVQVDGREHVVDAARVGTHTLSLLVQHAPSESRTTRVHASSRVRSHEVTLATDPATKQLVARVGTALVPTNINGRRRSGRKDDGSHGGGPQRLVAPMPGKVVRVLVSKGDRVQRRQPLVVIEAMKMENELRAAGDGAVAEVHVREGQSVEAGTLLALVAPQ